MKKLLFAAVMTLFAVNASAQFGIIRFGVKGGLISDNIDIVKGGKSGSTVLSSDSKLGWQVGLMSRVNLPMFHIQPEVLFNKHAYTLKSTANNSRADVKVNTVDIPVLMGLRLLMLRMEAGPVFNVMTETKVKHNRNASHHVDVDRSSISFALNLGVDIYKVNFDIRYNGNFKRVKQDIAVGDGASYMYRTKFNNWTFSLGYMF